MVNNEKAFKSFVIKVDGGYFRIDESQDPEYPGVDIEFIADNDDGRNLSRPRILFEKPIDGELRVLVWNNKNDEDYSEEINFK